MLIGRSKQQEELRALVESRESQFCAIYGRRRIGKTYLVRETFNYHFTFQHTGLADQPLKKQLSSFRDSLISAGAPKQPIPKNWSEAFTALQTFLQNSEEKKKIIFIDELSWIDTPKSGFVSALEHFWNAWATARKEQDIVLIVCGSSTSWITNKIINNHGGLHNRLTCTIHLEPFTLSECEKFAKTAQLGFSRTDIANAYMIFGGVPFYWSLLKRTESLPQNIDRLFFDKDAKLKYEYREMFASLFKDPSLHLKVLEELCKKKAGLTREQLTQSPGLKNDGTLTKILEELEQCGFIQRYHKIGQEKKGALFQIIDNFVLFHFKFLTRNKNIDKQFWSKSLNTALLNTWYGLAFERLCLQHIDQIKSALGISGILTNTASWFSKASDRNDGAQIDLVIDRNDGIIDICEMKYCRDKYSLDKKSYENLKNKRGVFESSTKTRKAVQIVLISSFGAQHNAYYNELIHQEITLDELFK